MPIKKQEFYEGAALHMLVRAGHVEGIQFRPPFFEVNGYLRVYLKYSTKGRSPWGFTFTAAEQEHLHDLHSTKKTVIGLVCGADGGAAVGASAYREIAELRKRAVHLSCYRLHGEHFEIRGPDGTLPNKIAPSAWVRIFSEVAK